MGKKVVGLCGRMRSGKSEIAKTFVEYGYERVAFATPLKTLVSNILNTDIEGVNELKNVEGWSFECTPTILQYIANETDIPLNVVEDVLGGVHFRNTREMLQIIGTELIRHYNSDWHVNRTKQYIESSENDKFIIDDVRFQNEVNMIEKMGGDCWFVVRPNCSEISHHPSEETLKWQDFDNVLVNDSSVAYLKFIVGIFLENGYDNSMALRNEFVDQIISSDDNRLTFISSSNRFAAVDALLISQHEFAYNAKYLHITSPTLEVGDQCLYLKNEDNTYDVISNPLEIEDLKKWL